MRKTIALLAALSVSASAAQAQIFYNGQFDGRDGLASMQGGDFADIRVYENFSVGSTPWTVNGLFGEFLTTTTWNTAYWEIRSGVSAGNGGTLLHSGTNSATQVATGRSGFGLTEYRATVTGFTQFALGTGQYWMTVAPVAPGSGTAYVSTTSGVGGVNAVTDGTNNYLDGEGYTYQADYISGVDFAYGVNGSLSSVPEPTTVLLVSGGLAGIAFVRRRRRVTH